MLSSRVFWKLLGATAGLYLAAALVLGLIVSRWQTDELDEQIDGRLRSAAMLLADDLADEMSGGSSEALQNRVRNLAAATGVRFTLIDKSGKVLADSAQADLAGVAKMQSHDDRPEVVRALARGEGTAEHISSTLGEPYVYFAARADVDGKTVGVARAAMSRAEIGKLTADKQRWVWTAIAGLYLPALALSCWLIGQTIGSLREINDAVDGIARGDFQRRLYIPGRDELGQLSLKLNRLSQELDKQITQLAESHQRQATVLGGMIEGVIGVDRRERVLFANAAAGRLFDFRPSQVEGRRLLEVVRNHTLEEAVSAALATGQPQRLETTQDSGDKMSVAIQATPLAGDPCPGVVIVMHETTELRRLESLRRDFVANVSHELKTPLSSIKAYAETLRNGALDDRAASSTFVDRIIEQADRLHHLIVDMLSLARIESAQEVFEIVPVSIEEAVAECLANYQPAAAVKRIELRHEPQQNNCLVRADKEGLREILDNLVDNAIKYTSESGRVIVRWRATADETMASIEVEDTGIGIPEDELSRVFERFYRVDKARSRELGGTGLGLAIVKHLAQSFGGTVSATSVERRGSTFRVVLPLSQST
jgi:two-component system, OmpR family, phosphate regulon sensor histidine kinase PhoR